MLHTYTCCVFYIPMYTVGVLCLSCCYGDSFRTDLHSTTW